jgi:hypothetical protein
VDRAVAEHRVREGRHRDGRDRPPRLHRLASPTQGEC